MPTFKFSILIISLFFSCSSYGQILDDSIEIKCYSAFRIDSIEIEDLKKLYNQKELNNCRELILMYLGKMYNYAGQSDSAITCYKRILKNNFPIDSRLDCKFQAASELAWIYSRKNMPRKSLYYLKKSELFNPNFLYCGRAAESRDQRRAMLKAQCHLKVGKYNSAILDLLPYIFSSMLVSNHDIQDSLYSIYQMRYSKQEIASEFIAALGKIKLEERVSNEFTILKSKIKLFNNEVVLRTTYTQTHIPNSKVTFDKLIDDSKLLLSRSYIYIIATTE